MSIAPTPGLYLPVDRSKRIYCAHRSPNGRTCNRWQRHTGRHLAYLRRIDGKVLEVWGG